MSQGSTRHAARGGPRISPRPLRSQMRLGTPSCIRPQQWIRHAVSHSPRELRGHRSSSTRLAARSIARREPRSDPYHQRQTMASQRAAGRPRAGRPASQRPRETFFREHAPFLPLLRASLFLAGPPAIVGKLGTGAPNVGRRLKSRAAGSRAALRGFRAAFPAALRCRRGSPAPIQGSLGGSPARIQGCPALPARTLCAAGPGPLRYRGETFAAAVPEPLRAVPAALRGRRAACAAALRGAGLPRRAARWQRRCRAGLPCGRAGLPARQPRHV